MAYQDLFGNQYLEDRDKFEKRLEANRKRRIARERHLTSLSKCPVCGGRIENHICKGDGYIKCGLYYK